jgi:hypothetical protein
MLCLVPRRAAFLDGKAAFAYVASDYTYGKPALAVQAVALTCDKSGGLRWKPLFAFSLVVSPKFTGGGLAERR